MLKTAVLVALVALVALARAQAPGSEKESVGLGGDTPPGSETALEEKLDNKPDESSSPVEDESNEREVPSVGPGEPGDDVSNEREVPYTSSGALAEGEKNKDETIPYTSTNGSVQGNLTNYGQVPYKTSGPPVEGTAISEMSPIKGYLGGDSDNTQRVGQALPQNSFPTLGMNRPSERIKGEVVSFSSLEGVGGLSGHDAAIYALRSRLEIVKLEIRRLEAYVRFEVAKFEETRYQQMSAVIVQYREQIKVLKKEKRYIEMKIRCYEHPQDRHCAQFGFGRKQQPQHMISHEAIYSTQPVDGYFSNRRILPGYQPTPTMIGGNTKESYREEQSSSVGWSTLMNLFKSMGGQEHAREVNGNAGFNLGTISIGHQPVVRDDRAYDSGSEIRIINEGGYRDRSSRRPLVVSSGSEGRTTFNQYHSLPQYTGYSPMNTGYEQSFSYQHYPSQSYYPGYSPVNFGYEGSYMQYPLKPHYTGYNHGSGEIMRPTSYPFKPHFTEQYPINYDLDLDISNEWSDEEDLSDELDHYDLDDFNKFLLRDKAPRYYSSIFRVLAPIVLREMKQMSVPKKMYKGEPLYGIMKQLIPSLLPKVEVYLNDRNNVQHLFPKHNLKDQNWNLEIVEKNLGIPGVEKVLTSSRLMLSPVIQTSLKSRLSKRSTA